MIYVTVFLMLLLSICLIVSYTKNYKGVYPFDRATTLPLRGLLALLIVAHHLGQRTEIFPLSEFTSCIGSQIVAVFFFISGYGMCKSYVAKREAYINGFLKKRLGKLLPKFLILTIVMVLANSYFRFQPIDIQVLSLITKGSTPLPHSWFIYTIVYVYLAFYLCAFSGARPQYVGISFTLSSIAYILVFSKVLHFSSYWWLTIISVNLGYYVAMYEKEISDVLINKKIICCFTLAAFLFISCIMARGLLFVRELWILAQAFSVYMVVRAIGVVQWRWLCLIGTISLDLYLIHGIPLEFGQYIGLQNWLLWIFTYALSIPSAILLNCAFDRVSHLKIFRKNDMERTNA